jgi:hypothetical protein
MFVSLKPVEIPRQKYSFSLAAVFRFNNEGLCFPFVKLLFKWLYVSREHPCFWKELKLFYEVPLHRKKVFSKQILSGHRIHARKVISALVGLHFCQQSGDNWSVYEPYVPVFFFVDASTQIAPIWNFVHNFVLSELYVDNERLIVGGVVKVLLVFLCRMGLKLSDLLVNIHCNRTFSWAFLLRFNDAVGIPSFDVGVLAVYILTALV